MQQQFGKAFSSQVIAELNKARMNPRQLSAKLKSYLPKFKGNILQLPGMPSGLIYTEGPAVIEETIEYLNTVPSLPRLQIDMDLNFAAQTTAEEMGKLKDFGKVHSVSRDCINTRFYTYKGKFGQSTDFGSITPELVIMNLIIDDGDFQRKNRNMLFSDLYEKVGCGSAKNSAYKGVTVLMYATKYEKFKNEDTSVKYKTKNGKIVNESISQKYGGKNMIDVYNNYDNKGFNRAKEVLGDNFYTGEYDPRYVINLHNEEEIYLSGVPYRYVHNVSPVWDVICDTAKDPNTRKNFEKLYGVSLKEC